MVTARHILFVAAATLVATRATGLHLGYRSRAMKNGQQKNMKPVQLETKKLIIDTDAGADDAVAILMALGQTDVDVIALTCVNGNTALDNVVVNVLKTLKTAGRLDIPVFAGATASLVTTPPTDNYFGQDGFGDFEYPDPPDPDTLLQDERAADALVRLAKETPGELTLLALGPLTNVALAIRLDSGFLSNLKNIVVMGGSVEGVGNALPGIEFNFYIDPVAAHIVFNSSDSAQPIYMLPLETVLQRNYVTMDWRKNVLGVVNSPEVQLLNQAERYQLDADTPNWTCPDSLTAAITLNSSLIQTSTTHYVYVAEYGTFTGGAVLVDYYDILPTPANVIIVTNVDVDGFKSMLLKNLGPQ